MAGIFETAASLLLYLITGFIIILFITKSGMKEDFEKVLNLLFFSLALPSLFFVEITNPYNLDASFSIIGLIFLFTLMILAASFLSVLIMRFTVKRELFLDFSISMILPNVLMMPLLYIYNEYGASNSMMSVYSFFSVFFIPINYTVMFLFKKIKSPSESFKKTLSFLFLSQAAGLVFFMFSVQNYFPWIAYSQIKTLQFFAVPLTIVLLGVYTGRSIKFLKKTDIQNVGVFILLKQVLTPLLVFVAVYLFNIEYKYASVMMILSSCPASPFIEFKPEQSDLKHQIFFYSTMASLILLPLSIYLLSFIY